MRGLKFKELLFGLKGGDLEVLLEFEGFGSGGLFFILGVLKAGFTCVFLGCKCNYANSRRVTLSYLMLISSISLTSKNHFHANVGKQN